jgi:NitT/TauT family transport system substrate-binding protein
MCRIKEESGMPMLPGERVNAPSRKLALNAGLGLAATLAGVRPARAADLVPVHIATTPSESAANCYYADDQGFFKAQGIDAHIEAFQSSGSYATGVISGAIDIGAIASGSLVTAHAKGLPFVLLSNGGIYNAASPQTLLVVLKDSPLKNAADFKGKTIGVSTIGDIVQVAVWAWLDANGVDPKAVNYVEVPTTVMQQAVLTGRVDAAFLGEPFLTPALEVLRPVAAPASSIADHYLVTGWSTSRSWAAANSATLRKFQRAIAQASVWATKNHAAATEVLVRRANIPESIASRLRHVNWDPNNTVQYIRPVIDAMAKYGIIAKGFPPAELMAVGTAE